MRLGSHIKRATSAFGVKPCAPCRRRAARLDTAFSSDAEYLTDVARAMTDRGVPARQAKKMALALMKRVLGMKRRRVPAERAANAILGTRTARDSAFDFSALLPEFITESKASFGQRAGDRSKGKKVTYNEFKDFGDKRKKGLKGYIDSYVKALTHIEGEKPSERIPVSVRKRAMKILDRNYDPYHTRLGVNKLRDMGIRLRSSGLNVSQTAAEYLASEWMDKRGVALRTDQRQRDPQKREGERHPLHGGTCYTCQAAAVGLRDRRPEGGELSPACARHADPRVKSYPACVYCAGRVKKGGVTIDREHAHQKCHKEACR